LNTARQRFLLKRISRASEDVMFRWSKRVLFIALFMPVILSVSAQTMQAPDITKQPTLYAVPYAHLDTQWRWEFPQTISEYLERYGKISARFCLQFTRLACLQDTLIPVPLYADK
jgi:hypothetical protein